MEIFERLPEATKSVFSKTASLEMLRIKLGTRFYGFP